MGNRKKAEKAEKATQHSILTNKIAPCGNRIHDLRVLSSRDVQRIYCGTTTSANFWGAKNILAMPQTREKALFKLYKSTTKDLLVKQTPGGLQTHEKGYKRSHVAASFIEGCAGPVVGCSVAPLLK